MPRPLHKVSIFTYHKDGTTSATAGLSKYLLNHKIDSLIICKFPFLYSDDGSVRVEKYESGRLFEETRSLIRFYKPQIASYLKDFSYGLYYGFRNCANSEIFVGSPNIFVIIGLVLKQFFLVKKVVYYMIDYSPVRFQNRILNSLFYFIDKIACYHADEVWSLNKEMITQRILDRGWDKTKINYRIVPFGNNSGQYQKKDYQQYSKWKIAYFGGIDKNKGSELFVPLAKSLLKLGYKKFTIECLGGGDIENLKRSIRLNKLEEYFNIYGSIDDQSNVEKILLKCGIAIAPYYPEDKNNFTYYADSGKVKVYLGCGLPVVTTSVPPIASEIAKEGVGLISKYDPTSFAQSIIKICINDSTYKTYKQKAIDMGKKYDWNLILDNLFKN